MTIEKKMNNESATLIVSGRLDTQTAPELENELDSVLAGLKELTFDFSNLEYVSVSSKNPTTNIRTNKDNGIITEMR